MPKNETRGGGSGGGGGGGGGCLDICELKVNRLVQCGNLVSAPSFPRASASTSEPGEPSRGARRFVACFSEAGEQEVAA
jgi:hypothetical protein